MDNKSIKSALVIGGSNGLGCAIVQELKHRGYQRIYIIDKDIPKSIGIECIFYKIDLYKDDLSILHEVEDIDLLVITVGIGRLASFDTFSQVEIQKTFQINAVSVIQIISHFYSKLKMTPNFYCAVVSSISGMISSPLFSLYASTKAALTRFIESVNIELEKENSANRILNISPGVLFGTSFYGDKTNIVLNAELAKIIVENIQKRNTLYIPQYEEIYKNVIKRYSDNPYQFGLESYDYKQRSGRINSNSPIITGYLSGTFDLFHIGHLNLIRRAKGYCDYLVVGVHKDASHKGKTTFISFEERSEIIKSIKYVDKVIESKPEDTDIYSDIKYNYLFVGSDYKGTERFERYEEYFKDKDVKIIYLPYTQKISSTKLRILLDNFLLMRD